MKKNMIGWSMETSWSPFPHLSFLSRTIHSDYSASDILFSPRYCVLELLIECGECYNFLLYKFMTHNCRWAFAASHATTMHQLPLLKICERPYRTDASSQPGRADSSCCQNHAARHACADSQDTMPYVVQASLDPCLSVWFSEGALVCRVSARSKSSGNPGHRQPEQPGGLPKDSMMAPRAPYL